MQGSDRLIGTSTALVGGKQKNITKNFTLDQLSSFIQGGEGVINPVASDFQIAVFNQSGAKLTGSIMSQDVYPNGTGITVSGNLSTTGNLVASGTVTLGSGSNLIDLTSTTKFGGIAQDANGTQGTLNQILLSDTNGRLVWGNYTAGLTYQGLWNASTNSPGLSSSVGVNSTFYIVGTAGNTALNGNTDWQVGDWAIFVGTTGAGGIWQKIDNTSSITGNGTVNRMVMWSSNFTVTDGPLLDSSGTNVLSILDRSIIPSVSNTRSLGSSSLKWNMLHVNDIETTNINILSHVDLNSLPGTPGQVLTSGGAGAPAVWTTPTTGTITGAGTTNKIPLWTNNVAIGDSILTQLNAATPFTDTYLSVGSGGVSTTGLKVDGFFVDSTGSKGVAGQILSSTGTATLWKTGDDEGVTYTLSAGAQDGTSVPINLIDSLSVTTPVKLTGGTNIDVVRTSATEITLSSTDTNTTYDFGSSTDDLDVLLNLVGTPEDNSSVKLIGSGVTITQANDEVTFTVPAGDTYDLGSGASVIANSVELQLTSGSGTDNSAVTLTGGTGITVEQTGDVVTLTGVAQGITGSGTVNKLSKFDTATSLTDSIVSEVSGVSLTKDSVFRSDGTINFAGIGPCNAAGGGQVNCFMDDVATVDLSTDPFGFVQNDGKVSFIGFNFSNSTEADAFRSLYGVDAPLNICGSGGGTIANSVNVTVNFNNGATITFNVPSGNIGFNCGNDIGFGLYRLGFNAQFKGQAITYVSGSGSISNGDATVSDVKVSIAGKLDMSTNQIKNVVNPTDAQDAATKAYADTILPLAGGTVTGPIVLPADPTLDLQAATKAYVDSSNVGSITGSGTVNKLPKFGTTDSLTDSLVSEVSSGSPSSYTADNAFFVEPINIFQVSSTQVRTLKWLRGQDVNAFPTLTFPPDTATGTAVLVLTGDIILDADSTDVITAGTYNVDIGIGVSGGVWNSVNLTFSESDWLQAPGVSGNVSYANSGAVTSLVATIGAVTDAEIEIAAKLDMTNHKIINVTNPTDAQDAATKSYVDTVVTGQLVFQGDYDATAAPPFGPSVLQGYTYVVTVAGDYGGLWPIPLAVGDLIISNQDNPVDVGDYTEVNKQVDIASETTLGIANFPTGNNQLDVSAGAVTAKVFGTADGFSSTGGYVPSNSGAAAGSFLTKDGTWVVPPNSGGTVTGGGIATQLAFWNGNAGTESSVLSSDSNLFWDDVNNRLGIGTSSPARILHISSSVPAIRLQDTDVNGLYHEILATAAGEFQFNADKDNVQADSKFTFAVDGSEKMRIDSSGSVLINRQSANATYLPKLEISGTANDGTEGVLIGSYLPTLTFQDFSGGSTVGQIQQDGTGLVFNNNNAERMRIDSSGNVISGFNTTSGNYNFTSTNYKIEGGNNFGDLRISAPRFRYFHDGSIINLNIDNGLHQFYDTIGNESMRIDSVGNVGIGADNPSTAKLVIETGPISGIDLYRSSVNANFEAFRFRDSTNANTEASIGWGGDQLRLNSTSNTVFTTEGSERMRIDSSGSVGIGTGSAIDAKLHILGSDIKLQALGQGGATFLLNGGNNTSIYSDINYGNIKSIVTSGVTNAESGALTFETRNSGTTSERMRITSNGNVGIGTASPAVSLDISATDAVKIPVGANSDRPTTGVSNGMLRYNSDALEFEGYSNGAWGAIGGGGASATITTQNAVGDGTNLTFALGATPNGGSSSFVDVFIDGVYQEISTYSISGTNLVFNAGNAPATGTNVETKTTADYNVGAAVQTVSLGQSNETGNVNLRIAPVEVLSATTPTAAANHLYIFTATSGTPSTLTLPSNPVSGDSIKISNIGGLANVITPSGTDKIMGVAGSMTIDNPTAAFEMIWSGITAQGWIIIGNV